MIERHPWITVLVIFLLVAACNWLVEAIAIKP